MTPKSADLSRINRIEGVDVITVSSEVQVKAIETSAKVAADRPVKQYSPSSFKICVAADILCSLARDNLNECQARGMKYIVFDSTVQLETSLS